MKNRKRKIQRTARSTSMPAVVLVALIAVLVGFTFGWVATKQFSPEWVGAIGQWVGGLRTIATLIWAVLLFRHERNREGEKLESTARTAAERAARVTATCEPPQYMADDRLYADLYVFNGTTETIVINAASVDTLGYRETEDVPMRVDAGEVKNFLLMCRDTRGVEIGPIKEFSQNHPPTIEYEMNGSVWRRSGPEPPIKL
jgi:hypothetical protein